MVDLPSANFDFVDVGDDGVAVSVLALVFILLCFDAFDPRRSHDISGLVLVLLVAWGVAMANTGNTFSVSAWVGSGDVE